MQTERVFYITYLDADLLISRDESGTPDVLSRVGGARTGSVSSSGEATTSEGEGSGPAQEVTDTVEPDAAIAPEEAGDDNDDDKSDAAYSW